MDRLIMWFYMVLSGYYLLQPNTQLIFKLNDLLLTCYISWFHQVLGNYLLAADIFFFLDFNISIHRVHDQVVLPNFTRRDSIFSSEKCLNLNFNVKYMDPNSLSITYSRNYIITKVVKINVQISLICFDLFTSLALR